MAAIPVMIQGVMVFSDLGVGGGPMPGGPGGPGGAHPEHPIYYPPYPSHPIYNPGGPPGSMPPGYWGGGMGPGVKPQPPFPGQPPLGIWGPPDMPPGYWGGGMGPGVKPQPHPEHPIVLPPDGLPPGSPPVVIWPNPPEGQAPIPSHPIVLPPPPTEGTTPDGGKPPPADGGWGYHPVYGWGYFPPGGKPGPAPGAPPA